jgi:hypothetical protein
MSPGTQSGSRGQLCGALSRYCGTKNINRVSKLT